MTKVIGTEEWATAYYVNPEDEAMDLANQMRLPSNPLSERSLRNPGMAIFKIATNKRFGKPSGGFGDGNRAMFMNGGAGNNSPFGGGGNFGGFDGNYCGFQPGNNFGGGNNGFQSRGARAKNGGPSNWG